MSVYEAPDRGTSWLGPLLFGLTHQPTGGHRDAAISVVAFFAAGIRPAAPDAGEAGGRVGGECCTGHDLGVGAAGG